MQANVTLPSATDPLVIEQPADDCYFLYWVRSKCGQVVVGPFATFAEMAAAKALVPNSSGEKVLAMPYQKVPPEELSEQQQACHKARTWLLNSLNAA